MGRGPEDDVEEYLHSLNLPLLPSSKIREIAEDVTGEVIESKGWIIVARDQVRTGDEYLVALLAKEDDPRCIQCGKPHETVSVRYCSVACKIAAANREPIAPRPYPPP